MTITLDSLTSVNNVSTFSVTVGNHTNRMLVLSFGTYQGGGPSGVTYGGVAMTKMIEQVGLYNEKSSIWVLVAPTVGTANIVISGAATWFGAGAYSLYNVDQNLPNNYAALGDETNWANVSIITQMTNSWVIANIEAEPPITNDSTPAGSVDFNLTGASYQHDMGVHLAIAASGTTWNPAGALDYGARWNATAIEIKPYINGTAFGNTVDGGFMVGSDADLYVLANSYTATSTITPVCIKVDFHEAWGISGTMYAAIYSDNAGSPGTKLFSGVATYPSLFDGTLMIPVTGSAINNGTTYWIAVYAKKTSGTLNIDYSANTSSQYPVTWDELVVGSWTNSPTYTVTGSAREMVLYAMDDSSGVSPNLPNVYDYTTATESITVREPYLAVKISESETTTESITAFETRRNVVVSDPETATESITISLPRLYISKSESSTATESISAQMSRRNVSVTTDSSAATETITLYIPRLVPSVNDSSTATESVIVLEPRLYVAISESTTANESIVISPAILAILAESETITETVTIQRRQLNISSYTMDQGSLCHFDSITVFGTNSGLYEAQTFTPSRTSRLTRITVRMSKNGLPSDAVQLNIYADNAGVPGTLLATADNTIVGSTLQMLYPMTSCDFTFTSGPTLTAGSIYWIVFSRTGALNDTYFYYLQCTIGDGTFYSNGKMYYYLTSWVEENYGVGQVYDMYFEEYSEGNGITDFTLAEGVPVINKTPLLLSASDSTTASESFAGGFRNRAVVASDSSTATELILAVEKFLYINVSDSSTAGESIDEDISKTYILDQSNTTATALFGWGYFPGETEPLSQSFTPAVTGKINKITVRLDREGLATGNITCEIYSDNGSGLPNVSLMTSYSTRSASALPGDYTSPEVNFYFANSPVTSAGTKYHIVLKTTHNDPTYTNYLFVFCSMSDVYAGGNLADYYTATGWNTHSTYDIWFKEYYDNTGLINITDPSTATESISVNESYYNLILSETETVSESVNVATTAISLSVYDSTTALDVITLFIPTLFLTIPNLGYVQEFASSDIPTGWTHVGNCTWVYNGNTAQQTVVGSAEDQLLYTSDSRGQNRIVQANVTFDVLGGTDDRIGIGLLVQSANARGLNFVLHQHAHVQFLNDTLAWSPLAQNVTVAVGETWTFKAMYLSANNTAYGKAWKVGTAEPDWQVTYQPSINASFAYSGLCGNGTGTTRGTYDEFMTWDAPEATVVTESITAQMTSRNVNVSDSSTATETISIVRNNIVNLSDLTANYSLAMDGTNGYVTVTRNSGFPLYNNTNFSISMWVKSNDSNQVDKRIWSEGNSTVSTEYYLLGTGELADTYNQWRLLVRNASGLIKDVKSSHSIVQGVWQHIVLVDANGTVTLYSNGSIVLSTTYTRSAVSLDRAAIGTCLRAAAAYVYNGNIDDVRLYNTNLSLANVIQLMSRTEPASANLIGSYQFNEGSGVTTVDISGNGNTGTISTPTYSTDVPGNEVNISLYSYVNIPDSSAATEALYITRGVWSVYVTDIETVTELINSAQSNWYVVTSDSTTATENISAYNPNLFIQSSDSTTATETISYRTIYNKSISDSSTATESVVVVRGDIRDVIVVDYEKINDQRTNYISNPSFETTDSWIRTGGDYTVHNTNTQYLYGSYSGYVTTTTIWGQWGEYMRFVVDGVKPGHTYTYSVYAYVDSASQYNSRIEIMTNDWNNRTVVDGTTKGSWERLTATYTVPSGFTQLFVTLEPTGWQPQTGTIYWDGVLFEESSSIGTYFDGNIAGGSWEGTANNSNSITSQNNITMNGVSSPSLVTDSTTVEESIGINVSPVPEVITDTETATDSVIVSLPTLPLAVNDSTSSIDTANGILTLGPININLGQGIYIT